jgi:glycerol-3-phosphate dehydrogenase
MNLVTSRPARDMALAAAGASGRMLTLVPWQGRAVIGTGQSATLVSPDDEGAPQAEIAALINDANHAFPALTLQRGEITLVHRGLVPAVTGRSGAPELLPTSQVLNHAPDGVPGAFTIVGAKYTTARATAERTVDAIGRAIGRRPRPSRTAHAVLPGAGIADHEALVIETAREFDMEPPQAVVRHLIARYAERAADIIRLVHERPSLGETVAPGVDTLKKPPCGASMRRRSVRRGDRNESPSHGTRNPRNT